MKHGDRIAITLHEGFDNDEFMCVVTQVDNQLLLTDEQGVIIATVRQFWQSPLTGSSDSDKGGCSAPPNNNKPNHKCEVCGKLHYVKPGDLRRGWGKTCCKAHAAILRERKCKQKAVSNHGVINNRNSSTNC
ncbi:hypothetical protein [Gibbsiella quercinecans]|uniref:hypothetical protein n=1 Tax=Gibbsiella quercinecans TaxID=929813 RepID=UPI00242E9F7B|nr:hypothetical protein [Gibbsiella quercinecans]